MTYTIISKILPPPNDVKGLTAVEGIRSKESNVENDSQPGNDDKSLNPSAAGGADEEVVPFKIVGFYEESIEMAFDNLQRIIHGERIKDVIEGLKVSSRTLPKPANLKEKTNKPRPPPRKYSESSFPLDAPSSSIVLPPRRK
jgi:hypothetical protein